MSSLRVVTEFIFIADGTLQMNYQLSQGAINLLISRTAAAIKVTR